MGNDNSGSTTVFCYTSFKYVQQNKSPILMNAAGV